MARQQHEHPVIHRSAERSTGMPQSVLGSHRSVGTTVGRSDRWLESASRRAAEEALWLASKAFDNGDPSESAMCLQFAEEVYPALRRSGIWEAIPLKRLVGHSVWRRIQPLSDYLRGLDRSRARLARKKKGFERGQVNGWWPGASPSTLPHA